MIMTNSVSIQDVLFFPQMRPEKKLARDENDKYIALGVPEQWIPIIQKAGYFTIEQVKKANPNKLHQEMCGLNKKYKLELQNPKIEEVKAWVEK